MPGELGQITPSAPHWGSVARMEGLLCHLPSVSVEERYPAALVIVQAAQQPAHRSLPQLVSCALPCNGVAVDYHGPVPGDATPRERSWMSSAQDCREQKQPTSKQQDSRSWPSSAARYSFCCRATSVPDYMQVTLRSCLRPVC